MKKIAKRKITKNELNFIFVGAAIAIILHFIVEPLKVLLNGYFPEPGQQMIVGGVLLVVGAYFWDLRKRT